MITGWMRNIALVAVGLVLLFGVAGTFWLAINLFPGHGKIQSGQIINKWYEPAREWDTTQVICADTGMIYYGQKNCIYMVQTTHHVDDEDYMITVQNCGHVHTDLIDRDECWTEDWKLTEAAWNNVQIGEIVERFDLIGASMIKETLSR